ncbi:MAG TPA: metallophosphoesterase [Beijerinckiaceae bacterium]|jgi:calcineurin-like phosphoesterase family protein
MAGEPRVWFTSDTHFGHGGALGLFKRPFASVAAMDEAMIAAWNARVAPDDVVWHLGDFAYRQKPARVRALLAALHGRKRLLVGNNDGPETTAAEGWDAVSPYEETAVDGASLVLCHYPFRSWNGQRKGAWNLHGHSHGALAPASRQADVGVDVWGFRPVGLGEILGGGG